MKKETNEQRNNFDPFPTKSPNCENGFYDSEEPNYIKEKPFILNRNKTLNFENIDIEIDKNNKSKTLSWSEWIWTYLNPYYAAKIKARNKIIENNIKILKNEKAIITVWEEIDKRAAFYLRNHRH